MKIQSILFMLLVGMSACSSMPLDQRKTSNVVPTGVDKDTAFKRARLWIHKTFKSGKDVIQLEDQNDGRIIAKGYIPSCSAIMDGLSRSIAGGLNLQVTIDLAFKDNKTKIDFSDLTFYTDEFEYTGWQIKSDSDLKKVNDECLSPVRSDLVAAIKGKTKIDNKDW